MVELPELLLPFVWQLACRVCEAGVFGHSDGEHTNLIRGERHAVLRLLTLLSIFILGRVTAHEEWPRWHITHRRVNVHPGGRAICVESQFCQTEWKACKPTDGSGRAKWRHRLWLLGSLHW